MARINGSRETDVLLGTNRADRIDGRAEQDFLHGRGGRDNLFGGDGSDMLVDGSGADRMTGGAGADLFSFVVDGDLDRILDFSRGEDAIDLSRLGVESFDDVKIRKKGGDVLIKAGGETIRVEDAKKGWFTAESFVFADRAAIDFEAQGDPDPEEYESFPEEIEGFRFNRIGVIETDEYGDGPSGYVATSGDNVAFNGAGGNSSFSRFEPFDFESAVLSAAWRDDLNIVVSGYLGDEYLGTQTLSANTNEPQVVSFDDDLFDYVTRVEINSYGGRPTEETAFDWTQTVIDDLLLLG